jgi:hypothetical protein
MRTGDAHATEKFLKADADPYDPDNTRLTALDYALRADTWQKNKDSIQKRPRRLHRKTKKKFPELKKQQLSVDQVKKDINEFLENKCKNTPALHLPKALHMAQEYKLGKLEKQIIACVQHKFPGYIKYGNFFSAMNSALTLEDNLDKDRNKRQLLRRQMSDVLEQTIRTIITTDPTMALADAAHYSMHIDAFVPGKHNRLVMNAIQAGANLNAKSHGLAPLHWAAINGDLTTAQLLIQNGAIVDVTDQEGHTPLIQTAQHGHLDLVTFLLAHGANPNAQAKAEWANNDTGGKNRTALHWVLRMTRGAAQKSAAKNYHPEAITAQIITALMHAGADPYVKDCPWELTIIDWTLSNNFEHALDAIVAGRRWQLDNDIIPLPAGQTAPHPNGPCKKIGLHTKAKSAYTDTANMAFA